MYFLFMLEYRGPNSVYFRILRGQTFAKMKKYLEFAKVSSREISSLYVIWKITLYKCNISALYRTCNC